MNTSRARALDLALSAVKSKFDLSWKDVKRKSDKKERVQGGAEVDPTLRCLEWIVGTSSDGEFRVHLTLLGNEPAGKNGDRLIFEARAVLVEGTATDSLLKKFAPANSSYAVCGPNATKIVKEAMMGLGKCVAVGIDAAAEQGGIQ